MPLVEEEQYGIENNIYKHRVNGCMTFRNVVLTCPSLQSKV